MMLRTRLLLFFLLVYLISLLALTLSTVYLTRRALISYLHEYMEDYMLPIVEFYSKAYDNPHYYVKLLAEDLASEDRAVVVMDDKKSKVVYRTEFIDGEETPRMEELLRGLRGARKGVVEHYAFVSKRVGDYRVYLLMKLDKVEGIKKDVIKVAVLSFVGLSVVSSLLLVLFLKRVLKPVEYLSQVSLRVYHGDMELSVERTHRRDELGILQNLYADMLEKLKSTMAWQRRFIGDITHSLKTPLTYVKGQLELISMGVYDKDKLSQVTEGMQIQIGKMERLINHLVMLSRLESGMPLKKRRVPLSEIFAELDEEYEFVRKTHALSVKYPLEDVEVLADKEYLKIAISNLIENSYKYTPEGGRIELRYEEGCIVVEDESPGIKDTSKVFEKFYREREDKEGFGLGLSIVKAVADAHSFRVRIENREGGGVRASLCFNPED